MPDLCVQNVQNNDKIQHLGFVLIIKITSKIQDQIKLPKRPYMARGPPLYHP